jgi:hypothetical protein
MKSFGTLKYSNLSISDFEITKNNLMLVVCRSIANICVLKPDRKKFYIPIERFILGEIKRGFTNIKYLELNNIVMVTRFSHGMIIILKFNPKRFKFKILHRFENFTSDLTNSVSLTLNGNTLYGNMKSGSQRILRKINLRKQKFGFNCYEGSYITSTTISERAKAIFLSGSNTHFHHINIYSNKKIFEIFLGMFQSLYYSILVRNDNKLFIGAGSGDLFLYDLKSRVITRKLIGTLTKSLNVFCMGKDVNEQRLVLGGYRNSKCETTNLFIDEISLLLSG